MKGQEEHLVFCWIGLIFLKFHFPCWELGCR